ncbi:MAG: flagellar hook-basal body complex protein FliE [Candidatus Riflebacteria bacterium]|nr:flagellar hook-basal body complex protein FliE [Candidatus Riflebacteria bacterium]
MRILQNNPFLGTSQLQNSPAKIDSKEHWGKFAEGLKNAINEVDTMEKDAAEITKEAALGRVENLHDVMIASEKARTAMNLTLEVRAKVIEAYKEITRLQF